MTTTIHKITAALSFVLAAGACTTEETDPHVELRGTTYCTTCNPNSPRANDYGVPELNLDGEPNLDGVTVVGVSDQSQTLYQLDVVGDDFEAKNAVGQTVLSGMNMVGTEIVLSTPDGERTLRIFDYEATNLSLATPGDTYSTYALGYKDSMGSWVNVCPESHDDPSATVATIIPGETYDNEKKEVKFIDADWFTIACAEEAVFKMKKLGYAPNMSFNGGGPASVAMRGGVLKMITASYCAWDGDYTSYTAQGTNIIWTNFVGTVNDFQATADTEAKWGTNGALCLETPRLSGPQMISCQLPNDCDNVAAWDWTTQVP